MSRKTLITMNANEGKMPYHFIQTDVHAWHSANGPDQTIHVCDWLSCCFQGQLSRVQFGDIFSLSRSKQKHNVIN